MFAENLVTNSIKTAQKIINVKKCAVKTVIAAL
jgi:hypothetical protein